MRELVRHIQEQSDPVYDAIATDHIENWRLIRGVLTYGGKLYDVGILAVIVAISLPLSALRKVGEILANIQSHRQK